MSVLIDKIKEHPQIFHSMRGEMVRVWDCEDKLNLTFPEEYTKYLCKFGAIGFGSVEWTGMNVETELNVMHATRVAREADAGFPADCFVLRLTSEPDGQMILCDEQERIYAWNPAAESEEAEAEAADAASENTAAADPPAEKKKLICEGLAAYFEICLQEAGI